MNEEIRALEEQLIRLEAEPQADPLTKIRVINKLAWELRNTDPLRAYELSRHGLGMLEIHPDPTEQARCQTALADILVEQGDYQQALLMGNAAIQVTEQLGMDELRPYLYAALGTVHWHLGNLVEALEFFQQQYRAAQQLHDKKNETDALNNMGLIYDDMGDYDLALKTYQQALTAAAILDDKQQNALVLNNLAMTLYHTENYAPALTHALKSLDLAQSVGDQFLILAALDTVGLIYAKQRDYAQALVHFEQGDNLAKKLIVKTAQAYAWLRIGWLYTLQHDDEIALPHLEQALQGFQEIDQLQEVSECHQLLSELHERQGDLVRALHHYKQFDLVKEQILSEKTNDRVRGLQITHEVENLKNEAEIHRLKNVELQAALEQVKQLSGLLPICANCKKIRDDEGYWHDVAVYIRDHSEAEFSHGICPNCMEDLYPEFARKRGK